MHTVSLNGGQVIHITPHNRVETIDQTLHVNAQQQRELIVRIQRPMPLSIAGKIVGKIVAACCFIGCAAFAIFMPLGMCGKL